MAANSTYIQCIDSNRKIEHNENGALTDLINLSISDVFDYCYFVFGSLADFEDFETN